MSQAGSRYALLKNLSASASSDQRRELLRQVTDALTNNARTPSEAEFAELDQVLSLAASEYSTQVRTEFARLVASSVTRFCHASEQFAMDDIEVATPVLRHSLALTEEALLRVVSEKSQAHILAVTKRDGVSERLSEAIVSKGSDEVVSSLLANERARISDSTFEVVAKRAETSSLLQAPFIHRQGVPIDLLNDLYMKVEAGLRREIVQKFDSVSPAELEKAFERSRARITTAFRQMPDDLALAKKRLSLIESNLQLVPPVLPSLLREGKGSRTVFKLAFARLVDVSFDVIEPAVDTPDIDTLALLCRGANFDRALFVTMAIALDSSEKGLGRAEEFGKLYGAVPVQAAQRALRFWKVRAIN
ncbi:MAG TPA: DUF2336 domain-containing protein [Rhizomicrobium sp.]|jgi:uncharacterized protein (DUF2336 family)|nr:DUF2336 domain-containing protein [Rhizomicrobium sp.]